MVRHRFRRVAHTFITSISCVFQLPIPAVSLPGSQVKNYDGDVQDMGLTFTVEDNFLGTSTSHPLVPGGDSMPVTNDNRLLYCHLLADYHLNVKLGRPAMAFTAGLVQLIPHTSLR